MGSILNATLVRLVRITGLALMAVGALALAGYALGPLWRAVRTVLPQALSALPWPLLLGFGAAALGAVVLLLALIRERLADRKNDNNLEIP